jgi:protein phosphatase
MIELKAFVATHKGCVRQNNEDRLVVGPWILGPQTSGVAIMNCPIGQQWVVVFDGIGGQVAGATAATIAAESISGSRDIESIQDVQDAIAKANDSIYNHMRQFPRLTGMGSTVVGLVSINDTLAIFNVGDSRAYQLIDGYLIQKSEDDKGLNGSLTAALGGRSEYQKSIPHIAIIQVESTVRMLLASDGLFGHLDIEEIESRMCLNPQLCVEQLLIAALNAGGPDNVTIAIVDITIVDSKQEDSL